MRFHTRLSTFAMAAGLLSVTAAHAQNAINLKVLQGLAPVSVLNNSPAGQAALASDYTVTAAIQNGNGGQPLLLPFAQQQQQALRDAFITAGNGAELADGLGTKLGGAYQSLAGYASSDDGKTVTFTSVSPNVARLIGYTATLTGSDANSGKYFFSNGTTDGKKPVDAAALQISSTAGGTTDIFGKAYHLTAGSTGADPFGDSRPFQTEKTVLKYSGPDYFGVSSGNMVYLIGPTQNLISSPSFPSGHTTYGYTESLLLAIMMPERYQQMITRGAEYGNDRIIVGAHYAMDVIGGRTLASYDVAHLLAGDAVYLGKKEGKSVPITDYGAALKAARTDLRNALRVKCGTGVGICAKTDSSRFSNAAANEAFYESTQTYGLPVVYTDMAGKVEDVAAVAPEAGYLLKAAFPKLTLAQADKILTTTEGPGGGFLDNGSAFGLYSRLDLYKAGKEAAMESSKKS